MALEGSGGLFRFCLYLRPAWNLPTCCALGLNDELAHSSIRFSIGRFTTEEEIDYAIKLICDLSVVCARCPPCGRCSRMASIRTRSNGHITDPASMAGVW